MIKTISISLYGPALLNKFSVSSHWTLFCPWMKVNTTEHNERNRICNFEMILSSFCLQIFYVSNSFLLSLSTSTELENKFSQNDNFLTCAHDIINDDALWNESWSYEVFPSRSVLIVTESSSGKIIYLWFTRLRVKLWKHDRVYDFFSHLN